ncbi:MAG TPA: carbohydrate ABC transporter permease [Clostridiaceae bacterium]|nr:carbohydrate ABC transporter permease [Clostridiaceae bacterium]
MVRKTSDIIFDFIVYFSLIFSCICILFPLLYVVSVSLTPYAEVIKNGGFMVIPRKITFESYILFFKESRLPRAYMVTIFITVIGTFLNLLFTTTLAYPLSRKNLPGKNKILFMIFFTMLFSGGTIPTYLVVKFIGLLNSVWAMIIPGLVNTYNLLIMKNFFANIDESLFEAARIDGAGETRVLVQIVLPLSKAILSTIGLYYGVAHWNQYYSAIMYIDDSDIQPLQIVLRQFLAGSENDITKYNPDIEVAPESLKMTAVILTALPVLIVYPFLQKYFTQGVMLGSIKG